MGDSCVAVSAEGLVDLVLGHFWLSPFLVAFWATLLPVVVRALPMEGREVSSVLRIGLGEGRTGHESSLGLLAGGGRAGSESSESCRLLRSAEPKFQPELLLFTLQAWLFQFAA